MQKIKAMAQAVQGGAGLPWRQTGQLPGRIRKASAGAGLSSCEHCYPQGSAQNSWVI
jgi:hypothetical protein